MPGHTAPWPQHMTASGGTSPCGCSQMPRCPMASRAAASGRAPRASSSWRQAGTRDPACQMLPPCGRSAKRTPSQAISPSPGSQDGAGVPGTSTTAASASGAAASSLRASSMPSQGPSARGWRSSTGRPCAASRARSAGPGTAGRTSGSRPGRRAAARGRSMSSAAAVACSLPAGLRTRRGARPRSGGRHRASWRSRRQEAPLSASPWPGRGQSSRAADAPHDSGRCITGYREYRHRRVGDPEGVRYVQPAAQGSRGHAITM